MSLLRTDLFLIVTVGAFCGKIQSGFPNPKKDFAFVWANPKTDHESLKSTLGGFLRSNRNPYF